MKFVCQKKVGQNTETEYSIGKAESVFYPTVLTPLVFYYLLHKIDIFMNLSDYKYFNPHRSHNVGAIANKNLIIII